MIVHFPKKKVEIKIKYLETPWITNKNVYKNPLKENNACKFLKKRKHLKTCLRK